jgi:hypothetical protein
MSFCWQLECAQFHGFRCLAYPLGATPQRKRFVAELKDIQSHPSVDLKQTFPGLHLAYREFSKIKALDQSGKQYSEMTFSSSRRVRKRYHSEVRGLDYANRFTAGAIQSDHRAYAVLPVVPFPDLTFKAIGIPE